RHRQPAHVLAGEHGGARGLAGSARGGGGRRRPGGGQVLGAAAPAPRRAARARLADDGGWRKFWNALPGPRADGSHYQVPGLSVLEYAGDGKFSYEEDIMNMGHVRDVSAERV